MAATSEKSWTSLLLDKKWIQKIVEEQNTALALMEVIFAVLLRRRETGPEAHGLETITAGAT